MNNFDIDKSLGSNKEYILKILLAIINSVDNSISTDINKKIKNIDRLVYKNKVLLLSTIKDSKRRYEGDIILAPNKFLYQKIHEELIDWLNLLLNFFDNIIEKTEDINTNSSRQNLNNLTKSMLELVPNVSDLKIKIKIEAKQRLVRSKITFGELSSYLPDVVSNINEINLINSKILSLNELFIKYKNLMKKASLKFIEEESLFYFDDREVKFVELESRFSSRTMKSLKFLLLVLDEKFAVYNSLINEIIKSIGKE